MKFRLQPAAAAKVFSQPQPTFFLLSHQQPLKL
jgi:hypothetical protein